MARVQMLLHIQGGHASGVEWPDAGGILDTSEQEARDLVAGGMASWLPTAAPAAAPDAAVLAAETTAATPAADGSQDAENGSESDGKPRIRDPKDAWEMHAISLGVTAEMAAAMTKKDLIDQFGSPA